MKIFPAIDLFDGKAVRLLKGDYEKMTVYGEHPELIAADFVKQGAKDIHIVDLEGAKSGETPNIKTVEKIVSSCSLDAEIGGGIRSMEVIEKYLSAGVKRVILGTAAVTDEGFLLRALDKYGEKIAVGVDAKNGLVAIKGWTEKTDLGYLDFCKKLQTLGVKRVICTDISKDGAMKGANLALYSALKKETSLEIIASGGVSSLNDVRELKTVEVYGAIVGKAYYVGAFALSDAVKIAEGI